MKPYETKQVIVVRKELNMNMGKTAAQVAHASMAFLTQKLEPKTFYGYSVELSKVEEEWLESSFAKIVVWMQTQQELLDLQLKAIDAGIEAHLITDNGYTYFKGVPTVTCLALGPDYSEKLDTITRGLPLL